MVDCTTDGIAAKLCRDIGAEWFLPSLGELSLMYTNLHANGHGGFRTQTYWSSTEVDSRGARIVDLFDGTQTIFGDKDFALNVRAARAARAF